MVAAARVFGDQVGSAASVFLAFQSGAGELGQHPPDDGSVHWPERFRPLARLSVHWRPARRSPFPGEPARGLELALVPDDRYGYRRFLWPLATGFRRRLVGRLWLLLGGSLCERAADRVRRLLIRDCPLIRERPLIWGRRGRLSGLAPGVPRCLGGPLRLRRSGLRGWLANGRGRLLIRGRRGRLADGTLELAPGVPGWVGGPFRLHVGGLLGPRRWPFRLRFGRLSCLRPGCSGPQAGPISSLRSPFRCPWP